MTGMAREVSLSKAPWRMRQWGAVCGVMCRTKGGKMPIRYYPWCIPCYHSYSTVAGNILTIDDESLHRASRRFFYHDLPNSNQRA